MSKNRLKIEEARILVNFIQRHHRTEYLVAVREAVEFLAEQEGFRPHTDPYKEFIVRLNDYLVPDGAISTKY